MQGLAVNLEGEARARAETGMSDQEWMDSQESAWSAIRASGRFPVFVELIAGLGDDYDLDLDDFFEFGLQRLLDGLIPLLDSGQRSS